MVTTFDHIQISKFLKRGGFDYFIVDCEHGSLDYTSVSHLIAMARQIEMPVIVRIPEVKREVVLKYMEMGATGLLLPSTESVEQARLLVEYSKYAPLGNRGVSLLRAHAGYDPVGDPVSYMRHTNEETILMVQIESKRASENCSDILAVEGIDAAFVGPGDLSQSMGIFGKTDHPEFIVAVDRVIDAAKKQGKQSGIHLMNPNSESLLPWIAKGMTLNLWANEIVLLMSAAEKGIARLKENQK